VTIRLNNDVRYEKCNPPKNQKPPNNKQPTKEVISQCGAEDLWADASTAAVASKNNINFCEEFHSSLPDYLFFITFFY